MPTRPSSTRIIVFSPPATLHTGSRKSQSTTSTHPCVPFLFRPQPSIRSHAANTNARTVRIAYAITLRLYVYNIHSYSSVIISKLGLGLGLYSIATSYRAVSPTLVATYVVRYHTHAARPPAHQRVPTAVGPRHCATAAPAPRPLAAAGTTRTECRALPHLHESRLDSTTPPFGFRIQPFLSPCTP